MTETGDPHTLCNSPTCSLGEGHPPPCNTEAQPPSYQMAGVLRDDNGQTHDVLLIKNLSDGWVRVRPRDGGDSFDVDPAYLEL